MPNFINLGFVETQKYAHTYDETNTATVLGYGLQLSLKFIRNLPNCLPPQIRILLQVFIDADALFGKIHVTHNVINNMCSIIISGT